MSATKRRRKQDFADQNKLLLTLELAVSDWIENNYSSTSEDSRLVKAHKAYLEANKARAISNNTS